MGLRLARRLSLQGRSVLLLDQLIECPEPPAGWEYRPTGFNSIPPLDGAELVYIVSDEDKLNIRLTLAVRSGYASLPIVITLSESRLGKKLLLHLENFSFVSPAELAARRFVDALSEPMKSTGPVVPAIDVPEEAKKHFSRFDPLVVRAILFFLVLAQSTTIYFHFAENLAWVDSWYFVITLMTTVGFGDISLRSSSSLSKVIGTILMIASVTNTAILFALITDSLLRRRLAFSVGRRRVKQSQHVIVVGLGSVGFRVVQELLDRGESVTVIEDDLSSRFMRALYELRLPTIIGDAKLERTLNDAGVRSAKALISVTSDDLSNLEIGLNAKLLNPGVRVVLRIYDYQLAQALDERLGMHFAFSSSAIAAESLADFAAGLETR